MDALVAQYSRPTHAAESYDQDEIQQLQDALAQPLNLKFALPPTAAPAQ